MDGVAQNPGSSLPAGPEPPGADGQQPTAAAEIYIVLIPSHLPEGQQEGADWAGHRGLAKLRRFGPAVRVGVTVPPAQASQLLRVFERIALAVTWQATVIGSLVGAAAAHLPPAGTTIVVVLEIAIPPVLLRKRRGHQGHTDK